MITTIYLDALFLLNLLLDYCLLAVTGKLTDVCIRKFRILLAAVCGGLYSVAAVFYRDSFFAAIGIQLVASWLMVLLAYGFGSAARLLRLWAVFFCSNFAFGGCVIAVNWFTRKSLFEIKLDAVVASALLCYAFFSLLLRKVAKPKGKLCEVLVEFHGRECRFQAFADTGLCVKDPLDNAPVLLVEPRAVKPLFSEFTYKALCKGEPTHTLDTRFRLIPYKTVGSKPKLFAAFRPDRVLADGIHIKHALVALSPEAVSEHGEYPALIGDTAML